MELQEILSLPVGAELIYEGNPVRFVRIVAKGRAALINTSLPDKRPCYSSVMISALKSAKR